MKKLTIAMDLSVASNVARVLPLKKAHSKANLQGALNAIRSSEVQTLPANLFVNFTRLGTVNMVPRGKTRMGSATIDIQSPVRILLLANVQTRNAY